MHKGSKHTAEALAKISAANKGNQYCLGRKVTAETRAKLSAASKGNRYALGSRRTAEMRAKIGASKKGNRYFFGQKHTAAARAKISAALKGNKNTVGHKHTAASRARMSVIRKGRNPSLAQAAHLDAMHAANVGTCRSPETITRMRIAHQGNQYALGHHHTVETRTKMSVTKTGAANPAWLGGISREPYAWTFNDELKEEVRRRDGYKCQLCGVTQGENGKALPVHHCDYDKMNSDPVNLTALCNGCNLRVNANRVYWEAFFMDKALARARQGLLF